MIWRRVAPSDWLPERRNPSLKGSRGVITADALGAVWVTDKIDVHRIDPQTNAVTTYSVKDGLPGSRVNAIAHEARGTIWVGTSGGGVSYLNPGASTWQTLTMKDGLASDHVWAIVADAKGSLWFGTKAGVSRFDPTTRAFDTYTSRDGLPSDKVLDLACDDGAVWLGIWREVSRFDPASRTWTTYSSEGSFHHWNDLIQALACGEDGAVWLGARLGGASSFDPRTGSWSRYVPTNEIVDAHVGAVVQDRIGALWFGGFKGPIRLDPTTRAWEPHPRAMGVNKMTTSVDGSVWIGNEATGNLERFDQTSKEWALYTYEG